MECRIVIQKSARRLTLFSGGEPVLTAPIALGGQPVGHKAREGDGCTPEGRYFVCVRNENSKFYRSLGLSYPDARDAEAALTDGRITPRQHRAISRAAQKKRRPPWDTALGGWIMIHGGGCDGDWTQGCVAVDNGVMDALFTACGLGSEVLIEA